MTTLLSCQAVSKAFSARPLFQDITLGIETGERLGLIGPNGSGKTTLLRILAGLERPDSGTVSTRRLLRVGYVAQEENFAPGLTVETALHQALNDSPMEAHERATQINILLNRVGFSQPEQEVAALSGGWRKRLALACELIREPELLLMDEPTNHLDLEGILWLESLLRNASFACVLVTHDRYFLENVTNRIVELNRAYPEGYLAAEGAYTDFLTKKEEFLHAQAHQEKALETQVKREIEWLRRGPQARTTKAKYRIEEAGRMIEDLADLRYRNAQDRTVDIAFSATQRKTKELLVAKQIAKSLGGRTLFSRLDVTLRPGSRLGLLGPNGSGKTTLLRILAGEMEADAGTVARADGLRVVYFDQNREQLERAEPLRQALSPNGDYVVYRDSSIHVTAWAKRFLFRAEQLDMPVGSLSGGEQARVLIARLMLRPADLLILDEPTNDLDIPSLEVLEENLRDFPGALALVTHDRYLLDRVSSELLALDGKGGTDFFAEYAQWERGYQAREDEARLAREKAVRNAPRPAPAISRRLSTAEQRELSQMENTIMAAEEQVTVCHQAMQAPDIAADHLKMKAAWEAFQAAEQRVAALYARWEELEARRNG